MQLTANSEHVGSNKNVNATYVKANAMRHKFVK